MKIMKYAITCATALIITGCVTTQSFQSSMNRFIGQPTSALIQEFGEPLQQLHQAGRTVLVFQPVQLNIPLTIPTANDHGSPIVINSGSGASYPADCKVFFSVSNNAVTNWYSQGKACPNH